MCHFTQKVRFSSIAQRFGEDWESVLHKISGSGEGNFRHFVHPTTSSASAVVAARREGKKQVANDINHAAFVYFLDPLSLSLLLLVSKDRENPLASTFQLCRPHQ